MPFFKKMTHRSVVCFFLILLVGCRSRSLEDFKEEGEGIIRSLIQTLQSIHTREQLLASSETLESLFDRLVTVMIDATIFYDALSDSQKIEAVRPFYDLSESLRLELNRLYHLEEGQALIEKYQDRPLQRIDAYEKQRVKKKLRKSSFLGTVF